MLALIGTCIERNEVWPDTARRLMATDWGEPPIVVMDPGEGPPVPRRRTAAWRLMADVALDSKEPGPFLMLEDDVEFTYHIRWNLERWAPIRRELLLGTLYTPHSGLLDVPGNFWDRPGGPFFGAQGIVVSRAFLARLVRAWGELAAGLVFVEHVLGETARLLGMPVTWHLPNLVQHADVPSVLTPHKRHVSACFLRDWRAP